MLLEISCRLTFNPIAPRKAKTPKSFGCSECNRGNVGKNRTTFLFFPDSLEGWDDFISDEERIQHELLFYSQGPVDGYLTGWLIPYFFGYKTEFFPSKTIPKI